MKTLLMLLAALALVTAAQAYPTLAGPTGDAVLPTAEVVPCGLADFAVDYYNTQQEAIGLGNNYPMRLVYGVNGPLEIGAGLNIVTMTDDNDLAWNVNAKYQFPQGSIGTLALGARFAQANFEDLDVTVNAGNAYLVGTIPIYESPHEDTDVCGSIGVAWETIDSDPFVPTSETSALRVYGALDVTLAHFLKISAEYQTKTDDLDEKSLVALSARYQFNNILTAQVGYTNADIFGLSGLNDTRLFAGVNLRLGCPAE